MLNGLLEQLRRGTQAPGELGGQGTNSFDYPKILGSREQSTMVSNWTEYLRLSKPDHDSALLEICQYEALGEQTSNDEGEPEEPPDEIDGKKVVGIEDGIIIGGDLICYNEFIHFIEQTLPDAISWLGDIWTTSNELLRELAIVVGASTTKTKTTPGSR
jgi:hypothetical protein